MPFDRRQAAPLPQAIQDFEGQFRRLFHRDMTPDERRFSELARILLDSDLDEEQADDTAA